MKKRDYLFLFLFLSFSFSWYQFQNNSSHTGYTENISRPETLLLIRQIPSLSPFSGPSMIYHRIFLPTSNGLFCFSTNGESLWSVPGSFDNVLAITDSILIVSSNTFLYAFNLNGDPLWRLTFQNQIWHPTIWDTFIFITEGNRVWKLKLNGETIWSRRCYSFYNAPPAIDDSGRIFVVTLSSTVGWFAFRVYGFNQNGEQIFFHEEWTMSEPGGNRIPPTITPIGVIVSTYPQSGWLHGCYLVYFTGGSRRWEGTMWYSSPAYDPFRNRIYHVDDNKIVARDLNGNLIWRSINLGRISYSSPTVDGEGKIIIGTDFGIFYVFNPDGTINFSYETGSGILTHPIVSSDGKIFIASSSGRLYCFGPYPVLIKEEPSERNDSEKIFDIAGRKVEIPLKKGIYFKIINKGGIKKLKI